MKYLLINPVTGPKRAPAYFPLGLAYIARVLLDAGQDVEVLDINAARWTSSEIEDRLRQAEFQVAGITGMVTEFASVRWIAQRVKQYHPEATIILGGGLVTAFPKLMLEQTPIDIAVIGEGEATIQDIAERLDQGIPMGDVPGLWYRSGDDLVATKPRDPIDELDRISFPARHLFPLDRYMANPVPHLRMFNRHVVSTNMITSRGCPYRCAYCFHGMWGHRYRARSAQDIMAEIRLLHGQYGVNGIFFMDDTFVLDRKRVLELCDLLIEEQLDIIWAASGRVNLVDRELLQRMHTAGCRVVTYGIESGSQKILDSMRKGVTVGQARNAIAATWEAGLLPVGFLMIGMFGETQETIAETVRFCHETGLVSGFSYATPFPGTELFDKALAMGKIGEHDVGGLLEQWAEWTDEIVVNLTDLTDEELQSTKRRAQRRIFWGAWGNKVPRYVRTLGLRNGLAEAIRYVAKAMRIGRYS